jgi:methyltransferase
MIENIREDIVSKNYKILQKIDHYSMSTDSFLLPYFANVPKSSKKKIIELCSGNGGISIILREKSQAQIEMLEIQEDLVELSRRSIELNKLTGINVKNGDIKKIKDYYKPSSFDYVIGNPPYFPVKNMPNQREKFNHNISRHEILCNLSDVIKSIKYLLKQNGKFSLVHRTYRISDIISECEKNSLAIKRIRFVYSKESSDNSKIVLVEGSISNVSDIKVEQPLYIYKEDDTYTEEMKKVYGIDS